MAGERSIKPRRNGRTPRRSGHGTVNLIVVYVIETLILPLGFLVVAWGLAKQTWRRLT
jgi:hypothetical protein